MFKNKGLWLVMVLIISIGLIGCGGAQTTSENKPANAATNTKPAETKPETASAEKVGVAECDEYIQKYEACLMKKVPEAQRSLYKPSLDQMRKSWKDAAANPQGKAALATGCKTALETAKTSMASFACEW